MKYIINTLWRKCFRYFDRFMYYFDFLTKYRIAVSKSMLQLRISDCNSVRRTYENDSLRSNIAVVCNA